MEGIAYEVAACLDVLERAGSRIVRTRVTGGGFAAPFSCQLLADVAGRPAIRSDEPHAALAGAMLLAGTGLGRWHDPRAQAIARRGAEVVFEPQPETAAAYAAGAARYREVVEAMLGSADR
jgi:xylulokinase